MFQVSSFGEILLKEEPKKTKVMDNRVSQKDSGIRYINYL